MVQSLPIDPLIPEILRCIERNTLTLLQAEPGAGKTTRVPPALLKAGFEQVYVLEPRRLAARMAARRVAQEMGEPVGQTVGFQVRFEQVGGTGTKLWYLTEGVLTPRLLGGANLPESSVVVLDEFHERHIETDLALALLRDRQAGGGKLRLLVMSATLSDFSGAPLIRAPGRLFPVKVEYRPHSAAPLEEQAALAVAGALVQTKKHILVFLPGAAEIRNTIAACERAVRQAGARLLPLYGDLTPAQQDLAVAPSDTRKVICSTNVAESSITIDGVEAVIDSGLARVLSYSPWNGLSRLRVEKISKSSAVQRAGRAGRTGPGLAIRLFPESDFVRRPEHIAPEILRADLGGLMLQLTAAGMNAERLPWLDPPPDDAIQSARELLARLGAVGPVARQMAKLPVHPRLARAVIAAAEMGDAQEACELAARLSETGAHNVSRLRRQLDQQTRHIPIQKQDPHAFEKAILLGFPDRVAARRGDRLLLANGASAKLDRDSPVQSELLVAVEIDDRSDRAMPLVRFASGIEPDWLLEFFPDSIRTREELVWNAASERVEQINALLYEQLAIDESRTPPKDSPSAPALLVRKALEAGPGRFTDADELDGFLRRVSFAAKYGNFQIPEDLLASALHSVAAGLSSFAELRRAGLLAAIEAKLPMHLINELAPTHLRLPSGLRARIEYHEDRPPSVASRLQDFIGLKDSPTVARGAVRLVAHLLAPNQRPVQVTTDLASFWKTLYPQVRRQLSRRYPKHAWPEAPE
jgi:ATP-dependent helicase HrpB